MRENLKLLKDVIFIKKCVFFLTWHVEIIKNIEQVVEICVSRIDFTAKGIGNIYT